MRTSTTTVTLHAIENTTSSTTSTALMRLQACLMMPLMESTKMSLTSLLTLLILSPLLSLTKLQWGCMYQLLQTKMFRLISSAFNTEQRSGVENESQGLNLVRRKVLWPTNASGSMAVLSKAILRLTVNVS